MPSIVTVNVSVVVAPTPATLQRCGAFISQGGTDLAPGEYSMLTEAADLTPLLIAPAALSTLSWSGNIVTATAASPHGLPIGQVMNLTIQGAVPAGYNGTFPCTITDTTHFTYPLLSSPGSETTPGSWQSGFVNQLTAMNNTFWAQGTNTPVFVLELGPGDVNHGVAALSTYLTNNPNSSYMAGALGFFYSYLVPREWDANSNYLALVAQYNATTKQTYFFTTTTLATYSLYPATDKSVVALVEAPAFGQYPSNVLTALSSSGTVATATTTTPHGVTVGEWFLISGCVPVGYNGYWQAQPGTTGSTLVYNLPGTLGAETVLGSLQANYIATSPIPSMEFSWASGFWVSLHYAPSGTNKVTPFNYSFIFGVTPFPTQNNNALLTTLNNANINYVGTGAEGGISNTIVYGGNNKDGTPFNFWYSVDWMQITGRLNVANYVINFSNDPINPLYCNQDGINRLQGVLAQTVNQGITFGLVLFPAIQVALDAEPFIEALNEGTYVGYSVVNAIPFIDYYGPNENPDDYKIGRYVGLSVSYTPLRGFNNIVINVNVSELIGG